MGCPQRHFTFTKRPYNKLGVLVALRGFLLLILTPRSESAFTEMPSCRDKRGQGLGNT